MGSSDVRSSEGGGRRIKQLEEGSFSNSWLPDFCVRCDDGKVLYVHRQVMSDACLYFRALFGSGLAECRWGSVDLWCVPAHLLQQVVQFIYEAQIEAFERDTSHFDDLLAVADFLQVPTLDNYCLETAVKFAREDNLPHLWTLAKQQNHVECVGKLVYYFREHIDEFARTYSEFDEDLSWEEVSYVLEYPRSRNMSVDDFTRVSLEWMKRDPTYRTNLLTLQYDFAFVSDSYLDRLIKYEPIIRENADIHSELLSEKQKRKRNFKMCRKLIQKGGGSPSCRHEHVKLLVLGEGIAPLYPGKAEANEYLENYYVYQERRWFHHDRLGECFNRNRAVAQVRGDIFVLGSEPESYSAVKYQPLTDRIHFILSEFLSEDGSAAVIGEFIYFIGHEETTTDKCPVLFRYDSRLNRAWERRATPLDLHIRPNVVVVSQRIYLVGCQYCKDVECYDSRTDEWRRETRIPMEYYVEEYAVLGHQKKVHVVHFSTNDRCFVCNSYDPATRRWCQRLISGGAQSAKMILSLGASDKQMPFFFVLDKSDYFWQ